MSPRSRDATIVRVHPTAEAGTSFRVVTRGRRPVAAPVGAPPVPVTRPKGSPMSVLHLLGAHVSVVAGGYDLGTGRLVPTLAAVVGLLSVGVGGLSLARSGRAGTG